MGKVEAGSKVKVLIKGNTPDGHEFTTGDKNADGLVITLGEGQMLPAIEAAIIGMNVGEDKEFVVEAENGIPRREELILQLEREALPADREYAVDDDLVLSLPGGDEIEVTVKMMTDTHVMLDANPPIAGKELNVVVSVIEIM